MTKLKKALEPVGVRTFLVRVIIYTVAKLRASQHFSKLFCYHLAALQISFQSSLSHLFTTHSNVSRAGNGSAAKCQGGDVSFYNMVFSPVTLLCSYQFACEFKSVQQACFGKTTLGYQGEPFFLSLFYGIWKNEQEKSQIRLRVT